MDAYSAGRSALTGTASGTPKARDGRVEAIRALRESRSQTTSQLKSLLVTAPEQLREQLRALTATALIATCARLRPTGDIANPEQATRTALRRLARRHQYLSAEIGQADAELRALVTAAAPRLIALPGVGPEVAGQVLTTLGDNPDRLHCGSFRAPVRCRADPGKQRTDPRHRLNRRRRPRRQQRALRRCPGTPALRRTHPR